MKKLLSVCILLVAAFFSSDLWSQTNLGKIVGTVRDASGSVVPGVVVTATNQGTSWTRQFISADTGDYEISNLVAGTYNISAELAGFKRFMSTPILLDAGRTVRLDVQLEVGDISTEIRVEVPTPIIDSETASISNMIDYEGHIKSPVSTGSRPWEALVSMPTVQSGSDKFVYSVAGSRGAQLEIHLDGIGTPSAGSPLGSGTMTMEGTSELKVLAVNNSAEYSQPAIFQQVSRSGTNEFHGALRYYHQNSVLNARGFFAATKPSSHDHAFGAWIGGPLVIPKLYNGKDKTFFMLSYEGGLSPGFANVNATVPTAAMRAGDFSSSVFRGIKDPLTGQAFPSSKIPPQRINPVSIKIQERFYPLPNYGDPALFTTLNHRIIYDNSTQFNNADLRIDQRLSRNNTLYSRVGWVQFDVARMEGNLPTIGPRNQLRNLRSVVISDTHTFTPQLVNEFRVGYHRSLNDYRGPQKGLEVLSAVGIQGIRNVPDAFGMPLMTITGVQSLTQVEQASMAEQMDQLSNALTWIRGRHTWKMGLDIRREYPNTYTVPTDTYGSYSFNGSFSNVAYADFLLGIPQQTNRNYPAPADYRRTVDTGWFIHDDFKLNPQLTLQLGLRYEFETAVTHLRDALYNFDPGSGQLVVVSEESRSQISPLFSKSIPIVVADGNRFPIDSLWRADKNNFAPRVGLAWRPLSGADFVIRSGFGVFYDRLGTGVADYSIRGPFTPPAENFVNSIVKGQPLFQFPYPFGDVAGTPAEPLVDAVATDLVNPVSYQYNLSIEKEYFRTGFRVSYIGSKTGQLLVRRQINKPAPSKTPFNQNRRPYPLYRDITLTDPGGNAHYDSLQIEAKRRFSSLTFNLGYTWANNISDVQDAGYRDAGTLMENTLDRRAERGRETFAIQHRFAGNLIWQIPIGRERRYMNSLPAALNHVLGGWETIWSVYFQSGRWFTPTFSVGDPSNTSTTGGRPDRLGDGNLENGTLDKYFDTAAFAVPPANAGRFGNCGRTVLEGPGINVIHLGLSKNFRISERLNFMLEMAVRNLFNHPNFANPISQINNVNVGKITATNDSLESGAGRNMQIRVRLFW